MNVTAFKRRKEFGKTLASDIAHRMRGEIVTCRLKPGEVLKFDTLRLAYGASFTNLSWAHAARRRCSGSGNRCSNAPSVIAISRQGFGRDRATRPESTAR